MCSCYGLEAVCGQVRKPLFKIYRRVPNGCENTARLDNKSCVCGVVVVVEHVRFEVHWLIQSLSVDVVSAFCRGSL